MTTCSHAASGHPRHRALCRRRGQDRRRRARHPPRLERERAGPEPARHCRLQGASPARCTAIPTATRPSCARRSGRHHGLDPGAHRLRRRLGRADQPADPRLCRAGRRGALQRATASSCIRSRALAAGATPVAAPETDLTFDVDAMLARVDAAARGSSSSPIPTTRPAPTSRATSCGGSMPGCRRRCCW